MQAKIEKAKHLNYNPKLQRNISEPKILLLNIIMLACIVGCILWGLA